MAEIKVSSFRDKILPVQCPFRFAFECKKNERFFFSCKVIWIDFVVYFLKKEKFKEDNSEGFAGIFNEISSFKFIFCMKSCKYKKHQIVFLSTLKCFFFRN
jgi:hypothetical protein